jgi:hypothetical protein
LSATTLSDHCYTEMFQRCTSLTAAPALPATSLASSCYDDMFNGCTSLTVAPVLPATTLADNCYQWMFNNCTALKISQTKTGDYRIAWSIPAKADAANWNEVMLTGTGGTFTGDPVIGTTYYIYTLDKTGPSVSVTDGKTYCGAVEVTVTDDLLNTVTLDGTPVTLVSGKFTVSPKAGTQKLIATDRAENTTTVSMTVNDGHTWDSGVITLAPTAAAMGEKVFTCTVCHETRTEAVDKLASETTTSPQTGDRGHVALWIALALISGGAIAMFETVNKRKEQGKN